MLQPYLLFFISDCVLHLIKQIGLGFDNAPGDAHVADLPSQSTWMRSAFFEPLVSLILGQSSGNFVDLFR